MEIKPRRALDAQVNNAELWNFSLYVEIGNTAADVKSSIFIASGPYSGYHDLFLLNKPSHFK